MSRPVPLLLGVSLGALLARERSRRRTAERFSAAALESLLRAIDANDPQTGAHVRRVATYALILADAMNVSERERRTIELAALFHDVGKIHEALFDIVHEHRSLTPDECHEVAKHPARGADVLAPIAPFHPRLADTFDAITRNRRDRHGRTARDALEIIQDGRGTQFDPDIADMLLQPPVVQRLTRAHDAATRRGRRLPNRKDSRQRSIAPDVHIRWRTRTEPPQSVRHQLARR